MSTNPQPTQAALECAMSSNGYFISHARWAGSGYTVEHQAKQIDIITNLPALTAIALAAQGVVDVVKKPMPSTHWEPDALKDLEWLQGYLANLQSATETLAATLAQLEKRKP